MACESWIALFRRIAVQYINEHAEELGVGIAVNECDLYLTYCHNDLETVHMMLECIFTDGFRMEAYCSNTDDVMRVNVLNRADAFMVSDEREE